MGTLYRGASHGRDMVEENAVRQIGSPSAQLSGLAVKRMQPPSHFMASGTRGGCTATKYTLALGLVASTINNSFILRLDLRLDPGSIRLSGRGHRSGTSSRISRANNSEFGSNPVELEEW